MGTGAEWVASILGMLLDDPSQAALFKEMWPGVCSEGTTYDAAFAAAPYLVDIARRVPPQATFEYLAVFGLIETYASTVPEDLEPGYRQALRDARELALQQLPDCPTDHNLRYLLAALAAFQGRADLASILVDLDVIQEPCPSCGTVVFPEDLQRVTVRDARVAPGVE